MFEYALKSFIYLMHLELIFEENFTNGDEDGIALIGDENLCV